VNPDPRHVKWINPSIPRGIEQDVILTVAEGGGMFAISPTGWSVPVGASVSVRRPEHQYPRR
jgi:hypothetical protein